LVPGPLNPGDPEPSNLPEQKTLESALSLYTWLSRGNNEDERAVIIFKARGTAAKMSLTASSIWRL